MLVKQNKNPAVIFLVQCDWRSCDSCVAIFLKTFYSLPRKTCGRKNSIFDTHREKEISLWKNCLVCEQDTIVPWEKFAGDCNRFDFIQFIVLFISIITNDLVVWLSFVPFISAIKWFMAHSTFTVYQTQTPQQSAPPHSPLIYSTLPQLHHYHLIHFPPLLANIDTQRMRQRT